MTPGVTKRQETCNGRDSVPDPAQETQGSPPDSPVNRETAFFSTTQLRLLATDIAILPPFGFLSAKSLSRGLTIE